ncbi:MAG: HTH-type transcriptional repressor AcnR [Stenotrophomonas maltophilia]|nr:MAG: HTH-type transcriptional repressor AcnR [Stenotrophomonas maltophilia]
MTLDSLPPSSANGKAEGILAAATGVFLEHGFAAASTDMLQRAAGVSKSTLYAHFPSKDLLFTAVIEQQCARFAATVSRIAPAADGDIRSTLEEIGRAYLAIVLSPTGLALFRVVSADAPRFPALARTFYLAGPKAIATLLAGHLQRAAAAGELDLQGVGVDSAAVLYASLLRGEGQMECLLHPAHTPSPAQLDHWLRQGLDTFLRAFAV